MQLILHCCSLVFLTPLPRSALASTVELAHIPRSPQIAPVWQDPHLVVKRLSGPEREKENLLHLPRQWERVGKDGKE